MRTITHLIEDLKVPLGVVAPGHVVVAGPEAVQGRLLPLLGLHGALAPPPQLAHGHLGPGVAEDLGAGRHEAVPEQGPQRGVDLLLRQIPAGAEHHEDMGGIARAGGGDLDLLEGLPQDLQPLGVALRTLVLNDGHSANIFKIICQQLLVHSDDLETS